MTIEDIKNQVDMEETPSIYDYSFERYLNDLTIVIDNLLLGYKEAMDYGMPVRTAFYNPLKNLMPGTRLFSIVNGSANVFLKSMLDIDKKKAKFQTCFAIDHICEVFDLSSIECFALILLLLSTDSRINDIISLLSNTSENFLNVDMIVFLYDFAYFPRQEAFFDYKSHLNEKFIPILCNCDKENNRIVLNNIIYNYIITDGKSFGLLDQMDFISYKEKFNIKPLHNVYDKILDILSYTEYNIEKPVIIFLKGRYLSGKKTQIKILANKLKRNLLILELNQMDPVKQYSLINNVCLLSKISDSIICIDRIHELIKQGNIDTFQLIIDRFSKYTDLVILLSESEPPSSLLSGKKLCLNFAMPSLELEQRIYMWSVFLKKLGYNFPNMASDLANKFDYTIGQILNSYFCAKNMSLIKKLEKNDIYKCIYNQVSVELKQKADLVISEYSWNDLILPCEQLDQLKEACCHITYRNLVFEKMELKKKVSYGDGVSVLLCGPPGTGKTMAAKVMANELNLEIFKVNLSAVVSKYIGETEKNLNLLFQEAKKSSIILLFDEADAILGKRTQVKDSHDKNSNLETAFLLQLMEEYSGMSILTTNYIENIDNAYFRRINYVVHFPIPDKENRKKIWINLFPEKIILDPEIDFDFIAEKFEITGGVIKNIVVSACFLAVQNRDIVRMKHLLKALKYELSKQGRNVSNSEFGTYQYLLS